MLANAPHNRLAMEHAAKLPVQVDAVVIRLLEPLFFMFFDCVLDFLNAQFVRHISLVCLSADVKFGINSPDFSFHFRVGNGAPAGKHFFAVGLKNVQTIKSFLVLLAVSGIVK